MIFFLCPSKKPILLILGPYTVQCRQLLFEVKGRYWQIKKKMFSF